MGEKYACICQSCDISFFRDDEIEEWRKVVDLALSLISTQLSKSTQCLCTLDNDVLNLHLLLKYNDNMLLVV